MLIKFFSRFPAYLQFLIRVFLLQLFVFFLYRLHHAAYNYNPLENFTDSQLGQAFLTGLQFDTSVTGYLMCLLLVCVLIYSFSENKLVFKIGYYLFLIGAILSQLVFAASIPYFHQFGNHLNKQVFLWHGEPGYIFGLIFGSFSYWGFLIPLALTIYLTLKLGKKWVQIYLKTADVTSFKKIIVFIISAFFLFVAIRGRITFKTPLHEGLSIISTSNFINSVAINPNYAFWKNSFFMRGEKYVPPADINDLIKKTQSEFGFTDPSFQFQRAVISSEKANGKNVVLVIMESMCLFKMGYYNGVKTYPLFDSLIKESVFFDHFFSSGIHTFNGVFSSLSGYPSLLDEQPLNRYTKKPFNGLGSILKANGYSTSFYTTHDKHFDNMAGFLKLNSFDNVYGDEIFSASKAINNLGVPDHVLFDEFIKRSNSSQAEMPFFSVLLTSSDHGPWDVPTDIPFKPTAAKKEDAAAQYADWALFDFMQKAKKTKWYQNTVFLFVGDHGLSMGHTYQMPISFHHIPFVIHCPQYLQPDTVSKIGYQPDIQSITLGLLKINYLNSTFGLDLLKDKAHSFVFFTADDKIGCVTNAGLYSFHLNKNQSNYLYRYAHLESENLYPKKKQFADSLAEKVNDAFQSAKYLIRQNYYSY